MPLTPQDFVSKWKRVTASEKQTYQEHFIDLCNLVGHPTPNEYDPTGRCFAFEMGVAAFSGSFLGLRLVPAKQCPLVPPGG